MNSDFTEAEIKLINDLVSADPNEDVEELAVCKAKLVVAEQTIVVLEAQLKDVTQQLEDESSRTMLAYVQMNELSNKLKSAELQRHESVADQEKPAPKMHDHKKVMAKPSFFPDNEEDDVVLSCFRLDNDSTCKIL